jgi:Glyoxalase-like domain
MKIRWMYAFIDRPAAAFANACDFWTEVTGTRLSAFRGERDQFTTLIPPQGDAHLKVQALQHCPDSGGTHLDLSVDDVAASTKIALGLGSESVHEELGLSVLRSPGGLPYCLVEWRGESTRAPVFEDLTRVRSRLDQVCLDVLPGLLERELEFWQAMTGWKPQPAGTPEFHVLKPPGNMPIRLLVQRLGDDDPRRGVTAHLDLACTDVDAAVARHENLGARVVTRNERWTVMRDPAGAPYCLTARSPQTGTLRQPAARRT